MRSIVATFALVLFVLCCSRSASAQSAQSRFQLGGQFVGAVSNEFDSTDFGVGGRFSWHPMPLIGAEAEVNFYPSDFADEPAFSGSRVEGLFGVTVGPQIGQLRPFAKVRPGFVTYREAPGSFPCPLIFPVPVSCQLASGETVFALDVGGGVEWFPTARTFVRVDAGDRILKYQGPVRDQDFTIREDGFFTHDFRFAIGGGVRF
jgi:hypothetical protein